MRTYELVTAKLVLMSCSGRYRVNCQQADASASACLCLQPQLYVACPGRGHGTYILFHVILSGSNGRFPKLHAHLRGRVVDLPCPKGLLRWGSTVALRLLLVSCSGCAGLRCACTSLGRISREPRCGCRTR